MRAGPRRVARKTKSRHPVRMTLCFAEDRANARARSCTRSFNPLGSSAAAELHWSGLIARGLLPRSVRQETLTHVHPKLVGPGNPPTKRSSPPAEKWGVFIGASP